MVFSNGGTLDKFIGDAIMAVWETCAALGGAGRKNCVRAAMAMRWELRQLNEKWRDEGRMGLGMGIGINQGEVIVGNIGSQERMDQLSLATPSTWRRDSKVLPEFTASIFWWRDGGRVGARRVSSALNCAGAGKGQNQAGRCLHSDRRAK